MDTPPIVGTLLYYCSMGIGLLLVIFGIFLLVRSIPNQRGTTNTYERFEDVPIATQLVNTIQQLQSAMDQFDEDFGEVCTISGFVEDGYLGSASAPNDESEYALSPEIQKANAEKRTQRAKNAFESLRKGQTGGHVLECFADQDDLQSAMDQFHSLQDSPQYKSIFVDGKLQAVQQTLVFNATYLKKGLASLVEQIQKPKEGFWDGATKMKITDPAAALRILQANLADLSSLHTLVTQHASAVEVMKQKQTSTQSGSDAAANFESAPKQLPSTVYS